MAALTDNWFEAYGVKTSDDEVRNHASGLGLEAEFVAEIVRRRRARRGEDVPAAPLRCFSDANTMDDAVTDLVLAAGAGRVAQVAEYLATAGYARARLLAGNLSRPPPDAAPSADPQDGQKLVGDTPLVAACRKDHSSVVLLLLRSGADPDGASAPARGVGGAKDRKSVV